MLRFRKKTTHTMNDKYKNLNYSILNLHIFEAPPPLEKPCVHPSFGECIYLQFKV